MGDVVIKVENLGKKYLIRHQQRESYTALRDILTNQFKSFGKRLISLQPHSSNLQPNREEFWALKNVSFEVKQGDRVGIIGRNGAGKTTLLKLLSRITEPTTGRITLKGRVASLLEVGTGFHPELTGRENIFLNGAILGMSKAEIRRKFDEIVGFAQLERFIDTPAKRYSSGMYVRLAFAVAAHLEPEIMLVDEVLAVGDAAFQKKCLGKMDDLAHEGRTVLFVSHNMSMILRLCQNALLMENGFLQTYGESNGVVTQYLATETTDKGEIYWEKGLSNQDVSEIKIMSVKVKDVSGQMTSSIDARLPFNIEMDYFINNDLPMLQMGIQIKTAEGIVVLQSFNTDSECILETKPGTYNVRCTVQGSLLNSGTYIIGVYADIRNVKVLARADEVLRIDIHNTANKGPYSVRYGLIQPLLKWETNLVAEKLDA